MVDRACETRCKTDGGNDNTFASIQSAHSTRVSAFRSLRLYRRYEVCRPNAANPIFCAASQESSTLSMVSVAGVNLPLPLLKCCENLDHGEYLASLASNGRPIAVPSVRGRPPRLAQPGMTGRQWQAALREERASTKRRPAHVFPRTCKTRRQAGTPQETPGCHA